MAIRFICANSACGREISAPDGTAGRKVRCPDCGKVQKIPSGGPAAPARPRRAQAPRGGMTPLQTAPQAVRDCPVCGTPYPADQTCPQCRTHKKTYAHEHRDVARFVKMGIVLAIVVGVIAVGIWLIKSVWKRTERGSMSPGYFGVVFDSKHKGESVVSMGNLRHIRDALERHYASFGEYPAKLEDLVGEGLPAGLLRAPDRDRQVYAYIPDQDKNMPGDNILVYEAQPIHRDNCNVIRLDGRIETITSEQLQKAVEQTRRTVQQR